MFYIPLRSVRRNGQFFKTIEMYVHGLCGSDDTLSVVVMVSILRTCVILLDVPIWVNLGSRPELYRRKKQLRNLT